MHCSGLPLSPHTYHVYESSADQSDRQSLLLLPASKSAGSLTSSKVDVAWVLELCNQGIQNQEETYINPKSSAFVIFGFSVSVSFNYSLKYQCSFNSQIILRVHSQTTHTRKGGQVAQKCPLFVNVHIIENVNGGRQVVRKSQNLVNVVCERPLRRNRYQISLVYKPQSYKHPTIQYLTTPQYVFLP